MAEVVGFTKDELFALARRDLSDDRLEEALLKLKQVISGQDAIVEALPFAARLYAQLGLMERARDCYERFLQTTPGAVLESFELGVTYFEAGDVAEARKVWDQLLKISPSHPPALFYSSLLAAQGGRVSDAKRHIDVLLKSTPADNLYVARARGLLNSLEPTTSEAPRPALEVEPYAAAASGN